MPSIQDNPCLACEVGQKCCKPAGLKLSRQEFEKHFKKYLPRLSVIKYKKMFIVHSLENQPCPYWDKKGCEIYQDRPVDCRMFPYDLNRLVEKRRMIEIEFYDQTDCPLKEGLFIPVDEAKELVRALARDVYGQGKPIHIKYTPGKKPPRTFGLFDPLIARLSKLIRTYR